MNWRLPALALLAALMVACASSNPSPSPELQPVVAKEGEVVRVPESGVALPGATSIQIGTHCGVGNTPIDFDGSFWLPAANLPERLPGLADPFDHGEIRVAGPGRATYVSDNGALIDLVRAAPGPRAFALCR